MAPQATRPHLSEGSSLDRAFAEALASFRPVSGADIDRAWARANGERLPLAWAAVTAGVVSELDATMLLARAAGLPFVDLAEVTTSALAVRLVPEKVARRHRVVPLAVDDRTITVATADPSDVAAEQDVAFSSGRRTQLVVASPTQVSVAIDRAYPAKGSANRIVERLRGGTEDRPAAPAVAADDSTAAVTRLCEHILAGALDSRASEVWLEPAPASMSVQFRVDGGVRPVITLPSDAAASVVARLVAMAELPASPATRPRQGSFSATIRSTRVEVHLLTTPVAGGERVVLRISAADTPPLPLNALGYDRSSLDDITRALRTDRGLFVFAGPPASGKTTSLYAALGELRARHLGLVSVESPIARRLEGVSQRAAGGPAGRSMAAVIGSALAADPAVLMVGDTRDADTAREVARASGDRLVLTSVHAADAASALLELGRLGIDPGRLSEILQLVVAQRLMRRLCPDCLVPIAGDDLRVLAPRFAGAALVAGPGAGCDRCGRTGYLDRVVAAEVVVPDDRLRETLRADRGVEGVRAAVERARRRSIRESAEQAVIDGVSSPDEVSRVFYDLGPSRTRRRQQPLVLVVDDDRVIRLLVRSLLEHCGYDVVEGENGRQAVEVALRERPDLLVLDLMMPEVDGYQALGLIRRELSLAETPVLVLTADAAPEAERRVLELGADDYLIKPFERPVLVQRVRAALSRAARLSA